MEAPPAQATDPRRARLVSVLGLAIGLLAPVARYWLVKDASLSYDEATYAELASHPWFSSYYPDEVFARHPPLAFLLLGAWRLAMGSSEETLRALGLLASLFGTFLVFRAVRARAGPQWGGLAAALCGAAFLVPVYGVQATLYPFAFLMAAIAMEGWAFGNERQERTGLALLCLTHLFGFLFLFLRLWRRRRNLLPEAGMVVLPLAWLLGALAAVLIAANRPGPGLGPWWQPTRAFEFFYQLATGEASLVLHLAVFTILILVLNPILLRNVWEAAGQREPWAIGLLVLTAFLLTGPAFFRFALPLLPIALVLGIREDKGARAAFVVGLTLWGALGGAAYVGLNVDPRAQNDVPGLVDWRGAVDVALAKNASVVAGPAPTSLAYYLVARGGYNVVDRTQGPDEIRLESGGRQVRVLMAGHPHAFLGAAGPGAVLVVPQAHSDAQARLDEAGIRVCGSVTGARLYCDP